MQKTKAENELFSFSWATFFFVSGASFLFFSGLLYFLFKSYSPGFLVAGSLFLFLGIISLLFIRLMAEPHNNTSVKLP